MQAIYDLALGRVAMLLDSAAPLPQSVGLPLFRVRFD